jgi:tetratricopeptide (TPR) repeat protein
LARTGAYAEAIAAYAGGGDRDAVVKLAGKLGKKLTETGQYEVIRTALLAVQAKQIAASPKATLVFGHVNELLGHWKEAEAVYRRALKMSAEGTDRIELMSLIAQLQMRRGQYRSCIKLCHQALSEPGCMRLAIRGGILLALGIFESALGKLSTGEKHLMDAAVVYHRSGDEAGEGRTQYLLASNIYYQQGAFQTAKDAARHAVVVFRRIGERRRLCVSLGVLGFVMIHRGEEREARDLSEDALRLAESLEYPIIEGYCHDTLGRCALQRRDGAVAKDHYRICLDIGERLGEHSLQIFALQGFSRISLGDGDYHAAKHHALAAGKIPKAKQKKALAAAETSHRQLSWRFHRRKPIRRVSN